MLELNPQKSTSGVVCMFVSAPITWQRKKQQCVALFITEAEYLRVASVTKEIIWLKKLFDEYEIDIKQYTLYVGNISATKVIKNPDFQQKIKHTNIKYHIVCNLSKK